MSVNVVSARKAVVAFVGFAVIAAGSAGLSVAEGVDESVIAVFDSVVALLAAVGVFQARNEPS